MRGHLLRGFTLTAMLVAGCAYYDQSVVLSPHLHVAGSSIGAGQTLAVDVLDERPQTAIGQRNLLGLPSGTISIDSGFVEILRQQIINGLKAHGFLPQEKNPYAYRSLLIQVRVMDYEMILGPLNNSIQTRVWLKAICKNGGLTMQKFYMQEDDRAILIAPTAERNSEFVNATVANVLQKMLNDQLLLKFLSQGGGLVKPKVADAD